MDTTQMRLTVMLDRCARIARDLSIAYGHLVELEREARELAKDQGFSLGERSV